MIRVMAGCLLMISIVCYAGVEVHSFSKPELEARYKKLTNELRCLVCQNQNIADSNAGLAKTLREETFRMINEGASDEEIIQFMVTRYGDFVLYKPPLKAETFLLWAGPFVLLLGAFFIVLMIIRRNRTAKLEVAAGIDDARRLLEGEGDTK